MQNRKLEIYETCYMNYSLFLNLVHIIAIFVTAVALKIVSDVADHANESMRQGVCITLSNSV